MCILIDTITIHSQPIYTQDESVRIWEYYARSESESESEWERESNHVLNWDRFEAVRSSNV